MASSSKGSGQVFWQEKESLKHSFATAASFNVQHDGKPHEYSIPFVAKPVVAVRVDRKLTRKLRSLKPNCSWRWQEGLSMQF